jgi:hypothetical protein
MLPQTDFRPQIHGFDFNNRWDTDDNYRNFIKDKLKDAAPIIVKIIVSNPAIGGPLLAAMGAGVIVGELLLGPLFELVVIPTVLNQITGDVQDGVDDFIPDHYGACGGMAYVSLDYYYKQWVIPKGINRRPDPNDDDREFIVPPKDPNVDQTLRDFIYDRLKDTYDKGGVLNKMLEWFIILNTLPSSIGGGPEIQKRTKDEWSKLANLLDQRKPQPICVQFDTPDIFKNHQVVAYGYGGNPFTGDGFINIYDNNFPNTELALVFTFRNEQIEGFLTSVANLRYNDQGFIVDTAGIRITDFSSIAYGDNPKTMKGFFCTEYIPVDPPIGWGLQSGLTVHPSSTLSADDYFSINGRASNAISFFASEPQRTRLRPIVEEVLSLSSTPTDNPVAVFAKTDTAFAINKNFSRAGDYLLFAKAHVFVVGDDNVTIVNDSNNEPLSRILYLPALNANARNSVHLKVLPKLNIIPYNGSGGSCYFPFVEEQNVILMVEKNPFPSDPTEYRWSVDGVLTGNATHEKIELFNLPPAFTNFKVKVQITNMNTGAIASGKRTFTTYDSEQAQRFTSFCEISHHLVHVMNPRFFDPLGPDNPDFRKYIEQNYRQIGARAKEIVALVNKVKRLEGFSNKDIRH